MLLIASLTLMACGQRTVPTSSSLPLSREKPAVVFAIEWDYTSTDKLLAWPIMIVDQDGFRQPPCRLDDAGTAEFVRKYLSKGGALVVLRGGRVIGEVTIVTAAQPEKDSCFGIVVQTDMPQEVAAALEQREEALLAATEAPPDQSEGTPERARDTANDAENLIDAVLVERGLRVDTATKRKTEAWTISKKPGGLEELIATSYAYEDEVTDREDFHALFLIARRNGNAYKPIVVDFRRTPREKRSKYCSVHFVDSLQLSSRDPAPYLFVKDRCYSGISYGVYDPNRGRVYSGPYYGS